MDNLNLNVSLMINLIPFMCRINFLFKKNKNTIHIVLVGGGGLFIVVGDDRDSGICPFGLNWGEALGAFVGLLQSTSVIRPPLLAHDTDATARV